MSTTKMHSRKRDIKAVKENYSEIYKKIYKTDDFKSDLNIEFQDHYFAYRSLNSLQRIFKKLSAIDFKVQIAPKMLFSKYFNCFNDVLRLEHYILQLAFKEAKNTNLSLVITGTEK